MPKREMRLVPTQPVVRWHHRDSALANGTAREAGRPGAPAAYAPGALRRLFGAAQPPARGHHPHAPPAGDGRRGAGHRVTTLELGTTAEAGVCAGYGALPVLSAGDATEYRGHDTRRGHPEDPPASETGRRPAPDRSGACPPGRLCLVLRLTAPGGSL